MVRALKEMNYPQTAIAFCWEASKELKALKVQVKEGIDITSDNSVANLHKKLGETRIEVLINNAAIAYGCALRNRQEHNTRTSRLKQYQKTV